MDLRTTLNENPRLTIGAVTAIVLLALAIAIPRALSVNSHKSSFGMFYSDDDGKTVFKDAPGLITPFDHNRKPAVLAQVYTADRGRHQWVQFLEKYSDASAQTATLVSPTDLRLTPGQKPEAITGMPVMLIKKPGAADWIPMNDPAARQLMQPSIPEGMGPGPIELVLP